MPLGRSCHFGSWANLAYPLTVNGQREVLQSQVAAELHDTRTMLFHVIMTHTPDNCPGYNRDTMPNFISGTDKLEGVAKDLNVKVHFLLWAAPEHVAYALLEADSLGVIGQFVNAIPIRQDYRVTPVEHLHQVVETAKAIVARANK